MADHAAAVRPATLGDADGIWPLARDFATSFTPQRAEFDRTLPLLLDRSDTLLLVAVDGDGSMAGYLLAGTHQTFLANGPVAWVEELMVREDRRGRGIGRRLMEAAEQWAAEHGSAYVSPASRRASAFYGALGYEE